MPWRSVACELGQLTQLPVSCTPTTSSMMSSSSMSPPSLWTIGRTSSSTSFTRAIRASPVSGVASISASGNSSASNGDFSGCDATTGSLTRLAGVARAGGAACEGGTVAPPAAVHATMPPRRLTTRPKPCWRRNSIASCERLPEWQ